MRVFLEDVCHMWEEVPRSWQWYIGGLSAVVALLFVVGFLTGGNHTDAPYTPTDYGLVSICPSASEHVDAAARAMHRLEGLGCPVPALERSPCLSGPGPGEVQVRACTDVLVGVPSCDEEHVDLVLHGERQGLVYIASPRGVAHAMGHVIGLGHTTAATSVMADPPGNEWSRVSCD